VGESLIVGHAELDEFEGVEWEAFSESFERFGDLCGFGASVFAKVYSEWRPIRSRFITN